MTATPVNKTPEVANSRFLTIDLAALSTDGARAIVQVLHDNLNDWAEAGKAVNELEAWRNGWMGEAKEAAYLERGIIPAGAGSRAS